MFGPLQEGPGGSTLFSSLSLLVSVDCFQMSTSLGRQVYLLRHHKRLYPNTRAESKCLLTKAEQVSTNGELPNQWVLGEGTQAREGGPI